MQNFDFNEFAVVFQKDLKEFFRDYRTILIMVVFPVILYPMLLMMPAILATKVKEEIFQKTSKAALVGENDLIRRELKKSKSLKLKLDLNLTEATELLTEDKIDVVVFFSKNFDKEFEALDVVPDIKIIYNNKKELSLVSAQHVSSILTDLEEKLQQERVKEQNVSIPTNYNLSIKEIKGDRNAVLVSEPIRNTVPFLLFSMILVAITYPAIDLVTGERERKSLRLLLLSPTSRQNIMLAKVAVVATCGLLTVALGLVSIYIAFTFGSRFQNELDITFSGLAVFYCLISSVPLVLSLSALAVYLASWCKTFQQGQGYFVPFLLFVMAGTGVCSMPELKLSSGVAFIPILNTALGIKEFLSGQPNWTWQFITILVSFGFALFVTWRASKILDREDLMYGMDKPRQARWKESDFAIEVLALVTVTFLLMFYVGQSLQQWDMSYGSIITQVFVIMAPALVLLRYVGKLSRETLSLKLPSLRFLIASIFLAPLCILVAYLTHALQNLVFPAPEAFTTLFSKLVVQPDRPVALVIIAIAFAPAVCEEIMFRGCILGLVKKRFGNLKSILFVGVIFGLFHLSVFRILPTCVLGIILTAITVYTGSIYPAMIIHFINNTTSIFLVRLSLEEQLIGYWPYALVSGLIGLAILLSKKQKLHKINETS